MLEVVLLVEVGQLPGVQQVVDVLQELVVNELGVHQDEDVRPAIATRAHQPRFEVLSEVLRLVGLGDLDLEAGGLQKEG